MEAAKFFPDLLVCGSDNKAKSGIEILGFSYLSIRGIADQY